MSVRSTLLAVAAVAAATLMTGAAVSPAMAQTPESVTVGFGDLNLANPAGREALDRRIDSAARQICGEYAPLELKMIALGRACRAEVLADARAQLARVIVDDDFASIEVSRAAL